jgi:hypothetical protein
MRRQKRNALSLSVECGTLSGYPLQEPCALCGCRDRGPFQGEDGLCVWCSIVRRVRSEGRSHAPSEALPPLSRGEGAVERPVPLGLSGDDVRVGPAFVKYRLFIDAESGLLRAAPVESGVFLCPV